jgi:hypothetical protein
MMKSGLMTIALGILIFLVGAGLTAATNGRTLFWGAMLVGAIQILIGLFNVLRAAVSR